MIGKYGERGKSRAGGARRRGESVTWEFKYIYILGCRSVLPMVICMFMVNKFVANMIYPFTESKKERRLGERRGDMDHGRGNKNI